MDERTHDAIARWERRWLALAGLMTAGFVLLIAYSLATEGGHVAQRSGRAAPEILTANALFADPGVRSLAPGKFQVSLVAQAFSFLPAEITLPVGAEVDFFATSRDTIHGFQLQNTTVNVHLIPGEVAAFRYTFDKEGEYRVTCNEYCGIGHHDMLGRITVVGAARFAGGFEQAEAATQAGDAGPDGASIYATSCGACHQASGAGVVGAFPPLAGHAPALAAADRSYPIAVLLYGLQGPIEVLGQGYSGVMPPWPQLGDAELAAILNHIVTAWDDGSLLPAGFEPYRPEEIAAERGKDLAPADVLERRSGLGIE